MKKTIKVIGATTVLLMALTTSVLAAGNPTCSGIDTGHGAIANHGEHVTEDYVFGHGVSNARGGAVLPGGPAAGGHFEAGVAPGASFCLPQSQSDGFHFGRD